MRAIEAVRTIMKKEKWTTKTLADKMSNGDKTYSMRLVNDRLHQNDITIGKLDEMVRAMGYKIVIVPDNANTTEALKDVETYRIF